MKTLESRKRTRTRPVRNQTPLLSNRTTGTKQRNVKQNTRGKQKWKVVRLEKARERLRGEFLVGEGFVTSLTTRPKTSTSTERNVGGKGGGGWRGYTSHCGYRPDNAILTRLVALWKCHCVLSSRSPAFTNLLYTSDSSCFLRLFHGYDGETFFTPPVESSLATSCPRESW